MSISINIYDLLPEGTISNIAWMLGIGIYHSGLVIGDKEYAYGGHSLENVSGIYTTVPRTIPPGGRFRTSIKYGSIIIMPDEVEEIICDIGKEFQGLSYNLLTRFFSFDYNKGLPIKMAETVTILHHIFYTV